MTVTAVTIRANEIYGDIEGDNGVFPRAIASADFRKYSGFKQRHVYGDGSAYVAFPFAELVGGKVVGLVSSGPGHAASDRQRMWVYDPATDAVQTTTFVTDAAPTTFDTSLIAPLMAEGGVVTLKVWTFSKTGGVVTVAQLSTQVAGGTTYAFWSAVKKHPTSGVYYRTGYGGGKAGLFSSPNGKAPWTFVTDLFSAAGRNFTECDFTWRSDGKMLAVCRDSSVSSSVGDLYWTTAAGDGSAPAAATLFTASVINGVQPQLRTLSSGDVLLMTADRTGASGSSAGVSLYGVDTTGVAAWRLPDGSTAAEENWTFRQMLEQTYSVDGSQPWPVLLADGRVCCPDYLRRSVGKDPQLFLIIFDPTKL